MLTHLAPQPYFSRAQGSCSSPVNLTATLRADLSLLIASQESFYLPLDLASLRALDQFLVPASARELVNRERDAFRSVAQTGKVNVDGDPDFTSATSTLRTLYSFKTRSLQRASIGGLAYDYLRSRTTPFSGVKDFLTHWSGLADALMSRDFGWSEQMAVPSDLKVSGGAYALSLFGKTESEAKGPEGLGFFTRGTVKRSLGVESGPTLAEPAWAGRAVPVGETPSFGGESLTNLVYLATKIEMLRAVITFATLDLENEAADMVGSSAGKIAASIYIRHTLAGLAASFSLIYPLYLDALFSRCLDHPAVAYQVEKIRSSVAGSGIADFDEMDRYLRQFHKFPAHLAHALSIYNPVRAGVPGLAEGQTFDIHPVPEFFATVLRTPRGRLDPRQSDKNPSPREFKALTAVELGSRRAGFNNREEIALYENLTLSINNGESLNLFKLLQNRRALFHQLKGYSSGDPLSNFDAYCYDKLSGHRGWTLDTGRRLDSIAFDGTVVVTDGHVADQSVSTVASLTVGRVVNPGRAFGPPAIKKFLGDLDPTVELEDVYLLVPYSQQGDEFLAPGSRIDPREYEGVGESAGPDFLRTYGDDAVLLDNSWATWTRETGLDKDLLVAHILQNSIWWAPFVEFRPRAGGTTQVDLNPRVKYVVRSSLTVARARHAKIRVPTQAPEYILLTHDGAVRAAVLAAEDHYAISQKRPTLNADLTTAVAADVRKLGVTGV